MRFLLPFCFLVGLAIQAQPTASGRAQPIDGFVAEVDGTVITVGDVIKTIRPDLLSLRNRYQGDALREAQAEMFEDGLNRLIEEELHIAKFNKLGAQLPPGIVRERADLIKRDRFKNDRATFQEALVSIGLTEQEWEDDLRNQLISQSMVQQQVRSKIHLAPREVRAEYDARKVEFQEPIEMELRAIAFRPASDEKAAARAEKIEQVQQQLSSGKPFDEVAKEFSEGPKASQGGYQGWIKIETLPQPMPEALQTLKKGEMSELVETNALSYFFEVMDLRGGEMMSLADAQPILEADLRERKFEAAYEAWIEGLKKEFQIQRFNPDISAVTGDL